MKYLELRQQLKQNIFTFLDIQKIFFEEDKNTLKTQLSRFIKKGLITKIKKGVYCFDLSSVDEFILANILYKPSYISLETALNYYGIIPDVPQAITSINYITTKTIKSVIGSYFYYKIKKELFFGFKKIPSAKGEGYITIAQREKAILDFLYLRKITNMAELRLNLKEFNHHLYREFIKFYPPWVQKIKLL